MKILGADVIGLSTAVGRCNSLPDGRGVIVIDLTGLAIVEFKSTGEDGCYGWYPGVLELHHTGFPDFNEAVEDDLKRLIAAHFLTMRESDIEPEDYTYELAFAGTGLGRGETLMELFRSHLRYLMTNEIRTFDLIGGDLK